jgi:hypothetical protein
VTIIAPYAVPHATHRRHSVDAAKKRGAWATPSVDDNHGDVHRDTTGRNQVSGSILLSDSGSFVASAEGYVRAADKEFRPGDRRGPVQAGQGFSNPFSG